MKNSLYILVFATILVFSLVCINKVESASAVYPTSSSQTLLTSLAPDNATLGQTLSWLIWTDPLLTVSPSQGQPVTLSIVDLTNATTIFESDETLGTLNGGGSLVKNINTIGFLDDEYEFIANITVGGMRIESRRYLDFTPVSEFGIYVYVSPYTQLVGDRVNVTIAEFNYPEIEATANMTISNSTNPSIYTVMDIVIPASNGSRTLEIPTSLGLTAGTYYVDVNATSTSGANDTYTTSFLLKDLILDIEAEYIGQPVNVSIRTSPTVTQSGLSISFLNYTSFPSTETKYVNQYVALTNGVTELSFSSSSWPASGSSLYWMATANATVDSMDVSDEYYFSLDPFDVYIYFDDYSVVLGTDLNLTITTTPIQIGATYNISVTNSSLIEVWSYGPSSLDSEGKASQIIPSTGLPVGSYDVLVTVNNMKYEEEDDSWFELYERTFNIDLTLDSFSYSGYVLPQLNITTNPGQTNANLTLEIYYPTVYLLENIGLDTSSYQYSLPLPGMADDYYVVEVTVTSPSGSNSSSLLFSYTNEWDGDGDGLSNTQEVSLGTNSNNPDSDADGQFDGVEVFHGSDPNNPATIIPEFSQTMVLVAFMISLSVLLLLINKKTKRALQKPIASVLRQNR